MNAPDSVTASAHPASVNAGSTDPMAPENTQGWCLLRAFSLPSFIVALYMAPSYSPCVVCARRPVIGRMKA